MRLVLLFQVLSTFGIFGLIWFVQIVHYPLFARVGEESFRVYAALHATRTTWVVAPVMLVELLSTALLLWPGLRYAGLDASEAWLGAALLALAWASTAFLQVPLHGRLQAEPLQADMRRLVLTNWLRTLAWSARTVLVAVWVWRLLPGR